MIFSLKGKVIVITGGQGFLGAQFVQYIRKAGGTAICADINCPLTLENHECYIDITSESSIVDFIDKVVDKYEKIDGWVNNAYPRTKDWGLKFEDIPYKSWKKNVDMHLNGYFLCSQKILAQMKTQQSGCLINIASIYGVVGPDFSIYKDTGMTMPAAYAAIKGGIVNLSRYLASYYGEHKIRVNCISPGGIFDYQPQKFVDSYSKKVPLRRMGLPDDIAPIVSFLCSSEASYITGQNIIIDGGWTCV